MWTSRNLSHYFNSQPINKALCRYENTRFKRYSVVLINKNFIIRNWIAGDKCCFYSLSLSLSLSLQQVLFLASSLVYCLSCTVLCSLSCTLSCTFSPVLFLVYCLSCTVSSVLSLLLVVSLYLALSLLWSGNRLEQRSSSQTSRSSRSSLSSSRGKIKHDNKTIYT